MLEHAQDVILFVTTADIPGSSWSWERAGLAAATITASPVPGFKAPWGLHGQCHSCSGEDRI